MDKAYDVKELMSKMKAEGMDVAEEAAKTAVSCVLDWVAESALKSENKMDDMVAPLIPVLKPHIMELIDKIDGEEG